jgi:uncharacterized protein involved in exopolysaccharide biosynthesis
MLDLSVHSSSLETPDDSAEREDSANLTLPPNPDLYITLIRSRSVIERIASQFMERLVPPESNLRSDEIVELVRSRISIASTDEGMLTITVTADDGDLAAEIANAVVAECETASKAIERQLLTQQAGYLEHAVLDASDSLAASEARLTAFSEKTGIIDPRLEADKSMRRWHELEVAISSARTRLEQRLRYHTERDPVVESLQTEVDNLEVTLDELRGAFAGDAPDERYATLASEWDRLRQDVRFHRDLVATMSMRFSVFRIRADQPAGNMAVLHLAEAPKHPAGPSKKQTLGIFGAVSVLLSIVLAVFLDQVSKLRGHEELRPMVDELQALLNPITLIRRHTEHQT